MRTLGRNIIICEDQELSIPSYKALNGLYLWATNVDTNQKERIGRVLEVIEDEKQLRNKAYIRFVVSDEPIYLLDFTPETLEILKPYEEKGTISILD